MTYTDCFEGSQTSSTYVPPLGYWVTKVLEHKFGSGKVTTSPSTDVVQVGEVHATMDSGLLLMIEDHVTVANFEGILGLGPPPDRQSSFRDDHLKTHSFAEAAGVEFFSICFADNSDASLRFNPPPAPMMLEKTGRDHWGLDFQGFSVGSAEAPVSVCDAGMKCAVIPDSGTTDIMGPQALLSMLYGDICSNWPRCNSAGGHATAFMSLMNSCIFDLDEVPSIFVHLAGADGQKQSLELTSWSYIAKSPGSSYCRPMFGDFTYTNGFNGPVWVLGTPLFYEYQVVFGMNPLSIGFSNQACTSCSQDAPVMPGNFAVTSNLVPIESLKGGQRLARAPRQMNEAPRLPSIDTTQPF